MDHGATEPWNLTGSRQTHVHPDACGFSAVQEVGSNMRRINMALMHTSLRAKESALQYIGDIGDNTITWSGDTPCAAEHCN